MAETYSYPQTVSQLIPPSEGAPWVSTYRPVNPWPGMFGFAGNLDTYEFWCSTARAWRSPAWVDGSAPFTGAVTFSNTARANGGFGSYKQSQSAATSLNALGEWGIIVDTNLNGIYPASGSTPFANWIICRDNADFRLGPSKSGVALQISHNLNAGFGGGRNSFVVLTSVQGTTVNTTVQESQWAAAGLWINALDNVGGTGLADPTETRGIIYGAYPQAVLYGPTTGHTGATNYFGVAGVEVDVGVQTGASVFNKRGFYVATLALDAVAGVGEDYGIGLSTLGSSVGWSKGYNVGQLSGSAGYIINPTDGELFGITTMVYGTPSGPKFALQQSKYGFNISEWVATDSAFLAPGFRVDGSGNVYQGGGKLHYEGNQYKLDNPGRIVTAAVLSGSSGVNTGNRVGDRFYDRTYHGIYEAATIDSDGSVVLFTIFKPSMTTAGVPSTTLHLIGGSGGAQDVAVDVTWTASTGIYIGESGGFTRFGSGTWAANGAVAVALGANAPAGASATVQEWFVVRNASNVARYIPAF